MNRRLPHNAFLCFSIASVIRLRSFDTPFPHTSPSHTGNTSRVLYAHDFDFPARTLPWVGIAQCQLPCPISQLCRVLNLCSCYLSGQYPHECYTLVISFFFLLGSELRSANRLSDFSAAPCTEPLLVLSTWPHHTQAIPSRVLHAHDSVLFAWILP